MRRLVEALKRRTGKRGIVTIQGFDQHGAVITESSEVVFYPKWVMVAERLVERVLGGHRYKYARSITVTTTSTTHI